VWRTRLAALGVSVTTTTLVNTLYHPQSNPTGLCASLVEFFLLTVINPIPSSPGTISRYIEWVLNNTVHKSTGFIPSEIFLKTEKSSPIYDSVEYPPKDSDDFTVKLTTAAEVQRMKAKERRIRHDHAENTMEKPFNF